MDFLYKLGWISVNSSCGGNRIKKRPTQAQINKMVDLGFYRINYYDGNSLNNEIIKIK